MTKVANMDVKREVSPTKSLLGKSEPKSCSWHLVVVTENQRAISHEIAKIWSAVFLVPPGTAADVVKATVAMRVATTGHELALLARHCPPFCTRSSCSCEKICFIVWYCHKQQVYKRKIAIYHKNQLLKNSSPMSLVSSGWILYFTIGT